MPASPSASSEPAIITRLRAAGCVFAEDEARLIISTARTPAEVSAMVDRRIAGLPRFVTVHGGAYFFLPGLRALRYIADVGASSRP